MTDMHSMANGRWTWIHQTTCEPSCT